MNYYYYTDSEIKELLKSIIILTDTREQENKHIISYFDKKKIGYKQRTLNCGDYSFILPKNEPLGIVKDIHFNGIFSIERKNGLDELAGNLTADRQRIESEFIKSINLKRFILLIEDVKGYENIINGNYRSEFNNQSYLGSLNSLSIRFNFNYVFIPPDLSGNFIYYQFYYFLRNWLLNKIYK
ncbi:ERCC4 domain-containing protein [Candidatus Dependentiae bacterium]|nr:ERCC4 domain-containing protein [Candidatus Dependentiae bacterium]